MFDNIFGGVSKFVQIVFMIGIIVGFFFGVWGANLVNKDYKVKYEELKASNCVEIIEK